MGNFWRLFPITHSIAFARDEFVSGGKIDVWPKIIQTESNVKLKNLFHRKSIGLSKVN